MRRNIFGIALFSVIVTTTVYISNVLIRYQETLESVNVSENSTTEVPVPTNSGDLADVEIALAVFEPSTGTFEILLKTKDKTLIKDGALVELELRADAGFAENTTRKTLQISSSEISVDQLSAIVRFKWRENMKISSSSNLFVKILEQSSIAKDNAARSTAEAVPVLIKRASV